jgi:hypothetical protein
MCRLSLVLKGPSSAGVSVEGGREYAMLDGIRVFVNEMQREIRGEERHCSYRHLTGVYRRSRQLQVIQW